MTFPHFLFADIPTPSWMTQVLRDAGILSVGAVADLEVIPTDAFNSRTVFLRTRYTQDTEYTIPNRFVLKRNTSEPWSIIAGLNEVRFYRLVADLPDHPQVLPPCYAADSDDASGESFLLLKDLSETHAPPVTRDEQISIIHGVPMEAYQVSVIDLLADFHAYWWDRALLNGGKFEVGFWSRDIERFRLYLDKRTAAWQRIVETAGNWLPDEIQTFYNNLFRRLPDYFHTTLAPRFSTRHNLTLIHGDTYYCNFLCPRIPGTAPTYLMDWQSPSCDLAAYDLVNLLAAFWGRRQRQENDREKVLLRRYYHGLVSHGVQYYTWDELMADYRAGLIFWVLMPVQDGGDGAGWNYWWPKMRCLLEAFEDWDCWDDLSKNNG